jgi:uncharacterized protein YehS (DUF1456 family)
MTDVFSLEDVKLEYPEAVENGEIVLSKLCVAMADKVSDLQDQMAEKDFQILKITERLEKLESKRQ